MSRIAQGLVVPYKRIEMCPIGVHSQRDEQSMSGECSALYMRLLFIVSMLRFASKTCTFQGELPTVYPC